MAIAHPQPSTDIQREGSPELLVASEFLRVHSLASEGPGAPERRRQPRQACPAGCQVLFIVRPSFQANRARVRDISEGGIGLVIPHSLDAGARLGIDLCGPRDGDSGLVTASVRHVTSLGDGSWLVGCSLSHNLADSEMRSLLACQRAGGQNDVGSLFGMVARLLSRTWR
jgi:PilZ domain